MGFDADCWRVEEVLFDRTLIGGADDRFAIFFRKTSRQSDVEGQRFDHLGCGIEIHFLVMSIPSVGMLRWRQNAST